jgi:hypothetical protein
MAGTGISQPVMFSNKMALHMHAHTMAKCLSVPHYRKMVIQEKCSFWKEP